MIFAPFAYRQSIVVAAAAAVCNAPTLTSITDNGSTISINWTLGSGTCSAFTVQSSTDNINWGSGDTGGCTSPRTYTKPTVTTYYRALMNCPSGNSAISNVLTFTVTQIQYSFLNVVGIDGSMAISFNGGGVNLDTDTPLTTVTLSPASQTILSNVVNFGGTGTNIDYYVNNILIQSFAGDGTFATTGNITTSPGNTYKFVGTAG
jgi:hypothetical protein